MFKITNIWSYSLFRARLKNLGRWTAGEKWRGNCFRTSRDVMLGVWWCLVILDLGPDDSYQQVGMLERKVVLCAVLRLFITIPKTYYVFITWKVLLLGKMYINFKKFWWKHLEFINWFPTNFIWSFSQPSISESDLKSPERW